ncbi:hypothetical protein PR202_ga17701 [Eleusine coracana subsp. coracana]|uniref:Protein EXORDIUM n=1 Tax=Eleusine coracana subsp. coracana TaxID=191504 RepID=A0AAV5CPR0_ELECO|nr:hypothetical protein PR202_ga17454 [Eleusine coracana subsp. coracana]GJN00512.1 hypothetical protein PR202_ga17701 [Eleusine coracana subsp. coracana]
MELSGDIPVSVLWYGRFTPAQKAIVTDFLLSLSTAPGQAPAPSVSQWWSTIDRLYLSKADTAPGKNARLVLAGQVSDEACSLGKHLALSQLPALAMRARPPKPSGGVTLVLTADDVAVEGFCVTRCGLHASNAQTNNAAYAWAGNPARQCPGKCAWPFGAQVVPPNGDVGVDGMVINMASALAGVVTKPFDQGDRAMTACPGVYGKGAYPGYAGELLVDEATGASYNANGAHGRKYLLPALFDPDTSSCATLV